ncbi:MAG: hypothetical protein ABIE43_01560 [Patescibacteria group bacterium]
MAKIYWILTDLDGVFLGRARERNGNGRDSHIDYANLLNFLGRKNYEMVFLTDRGVEQLAVLAYMLHASRFHAGESGAAAYCAYPHTTIINPAYKKIVKKVVVARKLFRKKFGDQFPIEPGVVSSLRVERVDGENLEDPLEFLTLYAQKNPGFISADNGDCIILKPDGINKKIGLNWLAQLYAGQGKPINFPDSLWIGDGMSDIPAGEVVLENGGQIAAVGNAHPEYEKFVRKNGGYLAEKKYTEGFVEILQHFLG